MAIPLMPRRSRRRLARSLAVDRHGRDAVRSSSYAASGLVAPWWAVALLLALWLVLFVRACRWWIAATRTADAGWLPRSRWSSGSWCSCAGAALLGWG